MITVEFTDQHLAAEANERRARDQYTRDEEREDVLRLLRRHECDAYRSGNAYGERLQVVRDLIAEIERGEHRR